MVRFQEDEAHDLAKVMMSRKASRLYGRMQNGIRQKKAGVDVLHQRRKEIDEKNNAKSAKRDKHNERSGAAKKSKKSKK